MFDLEQAIAGWRRQMRADGLKSPRVLDELESHLREEVERQSQSNADQKLAFCAALEQLGQSQSLTTEFAKVGETHDAFARIKHFLLTLTGVPNLTLATNMNTSTQNTNTEPAWATYLKSGAFALPAAALWLFVAIFVLPKFNEVASVEKSWIPALLRFGWDLLLLLTHYLFPIGITIAAVLALLEWRSKAWRRYRKTALASGVFFLNSAVLMAITTMVVILLIAASASVQHAK